MTSRFFLTASTLGSLALALGISTAQAQESVTVLGASLTEQCAAAADAAQRSGAASRSDLGVCNQAVGARGLVSQELGTAFLNRGVLHFARSEFDAAIADFNLAIKLGANTAVALNDRGAAEAGLHQYAAAEADFTQALDLKPERPETVYFNRAMAFEDQGNLKQAYLNYRKAAEANPTWDKPAKELTRFTVTGRQMS